ncbi:hypothetical protein [Phenylobacterium sp.]|uniref:hypothetical protein n=1 Tax=Phenylobacterium sp. TaxID=1871053 RepID=UPI00301E1590
MFSMLIPVAVDPDALVATSVVDVEAAWSALTTYSAGQAVYRVLGNVHQRFVSAQGSNTNHVPEDDDGTWWIDEGPTNAWAMFDDTTTTVTSDPDAIEVEIEVPATDRVDTIWLAALGAETVRVRVDDPIEGPIYDETFSLADPGSVLDWFAYFYDDVQFRQELLVTDLPNGAGSTLTVTVARPGDDAECGQLLLGQRAPIGQTRWGVRTEIRDYTRWLENDFGDRVLVKGAYRKLISAEFILENRLKDAVERELTAARGEPRLYVADEDYTTLAAFGTAKWAVEMSLPPDLSLCSIQIESNT